MTDRAQLDKFVRAEVIEACREGCNAAAARLLEQARALGRGTDVRAAGVPGVAGNGDETVALESGDDAAHGGRLDLLGGGQLAQRFGPGEDQHRERRQLRWTHAAGRVVPANAAQEVNGSGVQPVGDGEDASMGLDFWHGI